tara:strand:- start:118 stop:282 length:165 start_codon:yes stop_codon:yes gene_type:complete
MAAQSVLAVNTTVARTKVGLRPIARERGAHKKVPIPWNNEVADTRAAGPKGLIS